MRDISLHILDIAQNSIRAGASLIDIGVTIDENKDLLTVTVEDNGNGMSPEMLKKALNPFTTSRTERNVGLGIPLFAASCERTGETLQMDSVQGAGTKLCAKYKRSHIDRPPLGDIAQTIYTLTIMNPELDLVFRAGKTSRYVYDTRQIKRTLGEVPITNGDVQEFIGEYLNEGITEVFGGKEI